MMLRTNRVIDNPLARGSQADEDVGVPGLMNLGASARENQVKSALATDGARMDTDGKIEARSTKSALLGFIRADFVLGDVVTRSHNPLYRLEKQGNRRQDE